MGLLRSLLLLIGVAVAVISYFVYAKFIQVTPGPIVQLKDGKIQGIVLKSRGNREYLAYYGIPYAQPPVGELRFKPPVPPKPWTGVKEGFGYKTVCAQYDYMGMTGLIGMVSGSEDCLYLNVFVPANISAGKKLPVIAYIPGGYFMVGGAGLAGPGFYMDHDVIVVSIPYRVGALGFLNTGDGVIRGNMGLKDQNLALQWIQRNVETFGGDKNKVTLAGESAGAASVHYHVLSPASKGLFSRAIRESASSLDYWTMYRNSRAQANHFASKFNCPTDNTQKMADCLRALDVSTLLKGHAEMEEFNTSPLIAKFVPSIEAIADKDAIITQEPVEILKSGKFNRVPTLSGYNLNEGLLHSPGVWANKTQLKQVEDWFDWAPRALHYDPNRKDVSKKLRDFYFGKESTKLSTVEDLGKVTAVYGDRLFTIGVAQAAILEKKWMPTYNYVFDHNDGFNIGTFIAATQSEIHPFVDILSFFANFLYTTYIEGEEYKHTIPGTSHGDEIFYLWSTPLQYIFFRDEDVELSKDMVQLWVDFVYDKKPLKFRGVEFKPSPSDEKEDLKFLKLSWKDAKMINDPTKEARLMWESLNLIEQ